MSERYEDFSSFLEEDRTRSYGHGPIYPGFISNTIDFTKSSSISQLYEDRKQVVQRIIQIMEATKEEEQAVHEALKPHLKNLYNGKRLVLFRELLKLAVASDKETKAKEGLIMKMYDKLVEGFTMKGELDPTGFWKNVSEKDREKMEKDMLETDVHRSRSPPASAHWATQEQLQELWRQRTEMIASGRWHDADHGDIGEIGGAVAFPVEQGGKTRVCIDLRRQNTQLLVSEIIRLLNARATAQIIAKCLSENFKQPQFFQFKSDIKGDIAEERRLKALLEESERILSDSGQTASSVPHPDPDQETTFSFLPISTKRDMRQFYYQCGVAVPSENAIWFQRPDGVASTPIASMTMGDAKRRKVAKPHWDLTFSDCAAFGARTSIHECCGVSECLMLILNGACRLLCTLYIDDVHCLSREAVQIVDGALLDFVMSSMGFWFSDHKTETQSHFLQKILVVLGMAYTLKTRLSLTIEVEHKKMMQLIERGVVLLLSIKEKRRKEEEVLSYKGLYRHCTQLDRTKSYLAKALDFWVGVNFARSITKQKDRRQLTTSINTMQRAAKKVKPLLLSKENVNAPVAHLYTDAAAENLTELNKLLAKGMRKGLSRFQLKVGGFLALPSGEKKSFSLQLHELPGQITQISIGVLEALAARIAVDFFKDDLKGHYVILHVDNMGDVYVLARNSSRSFLIQSVSTQYHKVLMDFSISCCVTWICTNRNTADVLTRSERSRLLLQHFPDCQHFDLPADLSLDLRLWGIDQKEEDPSSCW